MGKELTIGRIEQLTAELHPDYTHVYKLAYVDGIRVGYEEHRQEMIKKLKIISAQLSSLERCIKSLKADTKEECYYLKKRPAGDEVYYWCDLDDHPCSKEYNDEECEEYNDQIKEEENANSQV